MKNYELFKRDPRTANLANDGQARLVASDDSESAQELLRYELEHFVCEGQYAKGIDRILNAFLSNLSGKSQQAAWVSGFYGSGKSHLLKMLSHLWVNTRFPDGNTARTLAPDLTTDIQAALRNLDNEGKRAGGGVFSVSGSMPEGSADSARLTILGFIFRACGLPPAYNQARFCLYLKDKGFYDQVRTAVTTAGKDFHRELSDLLVSPHIRKALLEADPGLGDEREVRSLLREQFPKVADVTTPEFISLVKEALLLKGEGEIPLTSIILDEVQHYVGDSKDRSREITELTEALNKQMGCRILVVGAGQNALSTDTPQFAWLRDRFTIPIQLSETDVEAVTRKVLLAKKEDRISPLQDELTRHTGEIERQLTASKIGPGSRDKDFLVPDYPILPTRRRFWERALRAIDPTNSSSLLRTQLRITHEALHEIAEKDVCHVVPGDFMFFQQQSPLVQQGLLPREISDRISRLRGGNESEQIQARICGLVFLIRKLSREPAVDSGVRANEAMLADLLVEDLKAGGTSLRKELPGLLDNLVEAGILLFDGDEYNLQTQESAEWDDRFRIELSSLNKDSASLLRERKDRLRAEVDSALRGLRLQQGASKTPRDISLHFGIDRPDFNDASIPVWVQDEWETEKNKVLATARAEGSSSPILFIFLEKNDAKRLDECLTRMKAAQNVIDFKGPPTTSAADEARQVMESRRREAERALRQIIHDIIGGAKVFKGGGSELNALELIDRVREGAEDALSRLFPDFDLADHASWHVARDRARKGDGTPLKVVNHAGDTADHPVCKDIIKHIGAGAEGKHIRAHFKKPPYGWPQDAIDAALICLHAEGSLLATDTRTNEPIAPRHLDQNLIPRAKFRCESVTISSRDRIAIKGVIQAAGISVKPDDNENTKALEFVEALTALAHRAGGDAPLPPRPETSHLDSIRHAVGNDQLKAILDQAKDLKKQAEEWKKQAELADKRLPAWKELEQLLSHAPTDGDFSDIHSSADSIRSSRLLLDPATDHARPLVKKAAELLRKSLTAAREHFEAERRSQLQRLESSDLWQKLSPEQQQQLQTQTPLPESPVLVLDTEEDLLAVLRAHPLSHWRDRTDALSGRVDALLEKAAQLLVPKAKKISLPSATISDEAELDQWLADTRKIIASELANNPVTL